MMPRLVLSLSLFLASCVVANASPQPGFTCDLSDHPALKAQKYYGAERVYYGGEFIAFAGYPEDDEKLPRVPSGSGEKYSDGIVSFHAKGDEGFLAVEADGTMIACKTTRAMATGASTLGSKIRSGPSLEADVIDRLSQGEFVEFIGETGAFLDGFQWVKVRYGEGQEGFVWGGTVCAKEREISGVHFGCTQ